MNDVADVEQPNSGDAIKRRDQRGIAEQGLRVLDRSLVNFDLRVELVDGSLLIVDLLLRDGIGFRELHVALQVQLRIFQMCLIAFQGTLRLIKLGLICTRIDLGEQLALLNRLTFLEADLDQQPGDLAADRC
jgi:hypothetical protein